MNREKRIMTPILSSQRASVPILRLPQMKMTAKTTTTILGHRLRQQSRYPPPDRPPLLRMRKCLKFRCHHHPRLPRSPTLQKHLVYPRFAKRAPLHLGAQKKRNAHHSRHLRHLSRPQFLSRRRRSVLVLVDRARVQHVVLLWLLLQCRAKKMIRRKRLRMKQLSRSLVLHLPRRLSGHCRLK